MKKKIVLDRKKKLSFFFLLFFLLKSAQLSVERQNGSRLAILALLTCASVLFLMGAFACLFFLKRNERIRKKLTHITRLKGVPTDYYQVKNISLK